MLKYKIPQIVTLTHYMLKYKIKAVKSQYIQKKKAAIFLDNCLIFK